MLDKTILITGATGSFGYAMVTKLLQHEPKKIIVYSRDEHKQVKMERSFGRGIIRYFIGDVRDEKRLERAFEGVDYVIHAAAMKHVHIGEYNPFEVTQTNIVGAQNVINAALNCGVKKVLAISSDKAVNPSNIYGASKLCSEKLFISGNNYSGKEGTKFAAIRFGNFIGSRGSIFDLLYSDIDTFPITDIRMTRFWVNLNCAAKYTFHALEASFGGEIFIPKIHACLLYSIVKYLKPDVDIYEVGIRPGEKLHEEMLSEWEVSKTWELKDFYVIFNSDGTGARVPDGFRYASFMRQYHRSPQEILQDGDSKASNDSS